MSCITAQERARLTAKLTKYESMIDTLEDAILNFDNVQSYKFDSGEGSQATVYRNITELENSLRRFEARANRIRRILAGTTNPAMNLRRYRGQYHGGRSGYC